MGIDVHIVGQIETLLENPSSLAPSQISERLQRLQGLFAQLYPRLPDYTPEEKGVFLRLLSRSNELLRLSMDHQMRALNLTPQKLAALFEKARTSSDPKDQALIATFEHMKEQFLNLQNALSRASAKVLSVEGEGKRKPLASAGQKRLRRSKWQKP
jgi:hypothetical protein